MEGFDMKLRKSVLFNSLFCIFIILGLLSFTTINGFAKGNPTSETPIKLNYSWFGPTAEPHTEVVKYFISEIDKRTNGKVKITYYPSGSLLPGPQAYDGVMDGISDMDFIIPSYTPSRFPLTFAWNLPLGIESAAASTRIFNETLSKYKPKELAGVKVFYVFGSSPCQLQTTKPVNTMADFKGMKIRCTGIGAEYVKQLGGVPVAMSLGQAYESLQKGVVEGTINSENCLHDWKLGELIKYQYMWNTYIAAFIFVMNKDKWESLPPDIQKTFEEVSAECLPMEIEKWDAAIVRGTNFGLEHGMKVVQPTLEITQALVKARQPLYDDYIKSMKKKGLPGKEFLDDLIRLTQKYK
jgi:TRAP-type C4-dicarboxylate transport system substrate-binding protein